MNPWWLLLLLPVAASVGFFLCAILTVSAHADQQAERREGRSEP